MASKIKFILLLVVVYSCNMHDSFWGTIKIDSSDSFHINSVRSIGDSTIIVTGWLSEDENDYFLNGKGCLMVSYNRGLTWETRTRFECNVIYDMYPVESEGFIILRADKYLEDNQTKRFFIKYFFKTDKIEEFILPDYEDIQRIYTFDESTYLIDKSRILSGGGNYLKTKDKGKTWTEHTLPGLSSHEFYFPKIAVNSTLWCVKSISEPDVITKLVAIDIDKMEILTEYELGIVKFDNGRLHRSHSIIDIKEYKNNIYLLGYDETDNNRGYIWKLNKTNNTIEVYESLSTANKQFANQLYFFDNNLFVTYSDISNYLPQHTLLYKEMGGKQWHTHNLPRYIYPNISFNGKHIVGIMSNKELFYKEF